MLKNNDEELQDLLELAKAFFKSMDFVIQREIDVVGTSGKKHHFEMLLKTNSDLEINQLFVKIVERIPMIVSMSVMNATTKYAIIAQIFVNIVMKVSVMDVITIIKKLVNK